MKQFQVKIEVKQTMFVLVDAVNDMAAMDEAELTIDCADDETLELLKAAGKLTVIGGFETEAVDVGEM